MGCGGSKPVVAAAAMDPAAAAVDPAPSVAAEATNETPAVPIRMMSGENRTTVAGKLRALFHKADVTGGAVGGDSKLTRDELLFHLDRKEMKLLLDESGLLDEFDTDHDGKVSLDEMIDKMDSDGNGTISLAEYLNAVLNSSKSPAAAAAASSTDAAMKALLRDLESLSEEDQMDVELETMRESMMDKQKGTNSVEDIPDHEAIAAKLQMLFVKADVEGGTSETIGNSSLTEEELKYHLDRRQMKKLLEDAGQFDRFDSDGDGKLSLDEILYHIDTDGNGSISLQEYLTAVLNVVGKSGGGGGGATAIANDLDAAIAAMNTIMDDEDGGGEAASELKRRTSAHSIFENEENALEKELNKVRKSVVQATDAEPAPVQAGQAMSDADRTVLAMKLGGLFQKADAKLNDGDLTKHELQFHLDRKEMKKLLEEAGNLERFDGNGDGKLSIDEILMSMDTDDNGSISLEEFLAAVLGDEGGLASTKVVSKFSEHWV